MYLCDEKFLNLRHVHRLNWNNKTKIDESNEYAEE